MLKENETQKNTSSEGNFTTKAIGTYENIFENVYFWEDFNANIFERISYNFYM